VGAYLSAVAPSRFLRGRETGKALDVDFRRGWVQSATKNSRGLQFPSLRVCNTTTPEKEDRNAKK